MDLIQQWQYNENVHPELLKDDAFLRAKDIGITSLQSYVPWANIEPAPGRFDFSIYDPLVEKILKHGLGWTPFLISGPSYAIPSWFKKSAESVPARCLEHGVECGVQSIWNPALGTYIDGFLNSFFGHYGKSGALSSVLLGTSGNWGESIFPVEGGFIREKHMHMGWWCGDEHAIRHYRKKLAEKYSDLNALNSAWGTGHKDFDSVTFPSPDKKSVVKQGLHNTGYRLLGWLPDEIKSIMKSLLSGEKAGVEIKGHQRQRLDFVGWYISSMTEWTGLWLSTARKYFKEGPLYIVTGGDGHPMLGADFFAQAKAASLHNAGLRVTNLTDNFSESFSLGRPVSSATRFYNTYFETEEACINDPDAVSMRIFDAVTSGANGVYFKNLIGYGEDVCSGRYHQPGAKTASAIALMQNRKYLMHEKPLTDAAFFWPNTSIMLDPYKLVVFKDTASSLRKRVDFDFADEGMIRDGALEKYSLLIFMDTFYLPEDCAESISKWVEKGGVLIRVISGGPKENIQNSGKGYVLEIGKTFSLSNTIAKAVYNREGMYPWERRQSHKAIGRLYQSRCEGGTYFYNPGNIPAHVFIKGNDVSVPPHSLIRTGPE